MAQIITSNIATTAADTPAVMLAQFNSLLVTSSATVSATGSNSPAVRFASSTDMTIDGTLYSQFNAALEGIAGAGFVDVKIGSSGNLYGEREGILIDAGGNTISNAGDIQVTADGIEIHGGNNDIVNHGLILSSKQHGVLITDGSSRLINHGDIRGHVTGVHFSGSSVQDSTIHNYGSISGSIDGSLRGSALAAGHDVTIVNEGLVEIVGGINTSNAVRMEGSANISLDNGGDIRGSVFLFGTNLSLLNSGDISGTVHLVGLNAGLNNSGHIGGGVILDSNDAGLNNSGYIGGNVNIFSAAGGSSINSGEIGGDFSVAISTDPVVVDNFHGIVRGTIHGGAGDDNLIGSELAADRLSGQAGDDVLEGNAGNDTLNGGVGADQLYGGAGIDTASYADAGAGVTANLGNSAVNAGEAQGDSYDGIENLSGSTFNDSITGNGGVNRLNGGSGNDALSGLDGNDTLSGGAGDDSMTGGNGDDIYIVEQLGDVVIEAASGGSDVVRAAVSWALGAGQAVERVVATGSSAVNLTGNELVNQLIGNSANNLLDGGVGGDTLRGGTGDDQYIVDNASDSVTELFGEGNDAVGALVSYTLGNHLEQLSLGGPGLVLDINGIGNSVANVIIGNDGNNQINGKGGVDGMAGYLGNDTFIFNAGQGNGDTITDFTGNGAAVGDQLRFIGYGTVAQGATFVQLNATQWQINSFDNAIQEVINFSNSAAIHASDLIFN
ncbi:MAG TPA: calcium-binding protein [Solimonas sp.]|nr:calcium-binding protein [Solimonas sp.]